MSITQNTDPVNSPQHYRGLLSSLEVIDVIDEFDLTYYEGRIVALVIRARRKDGLVDLLKAQYYVNRLIENVQQEKVREQDKRERAAAARHPEQDRHGTEVRHGAE